MRSRQTEIQELADRIRSDLASNQCSWEHWYDSLAEFRSGLRQQLIDAGGPITIDNRLTFRSLSPIARRPNQQWPAPQLAMLSSLHLQLAARGIDLIVVPIPQKEQITASRIFNSGTENAASAPVIVDPYRESMFLEILDAGIEIIDIRNDLIAACDQFERVYYEGGDNHPADGLIQTSARIVGQRLRRYEFTATFPECQTRAIRFGIPATRAGFPDHAYRDDAYVATQIFGKGGRTLPQHDPSSPVLLLADSCASVPTSFGVNDANFISHLIHQAAIVPHTVVVGGGAPQALVHLANAPAETLSGRKVCVFLFGEHYMYLNRTESPKLRWDGAILPS